MTADTAIERADEALRGALAFLDPQAPARGCRRRAVAELLGEAAPLYAGRAAAEAERMRAYAMVRLAERGFADECRPYIIEELETGINSFSLAAAARALRFVSSAPSSLVRTLDAAAARCALSNEFVDFSEFPARHDARSVSALDELAETRTMLIGRPPLEAETLVCCEGKAHDDQTPPEIESCGYEVLDEAWPSILARIRSTKFENQDGKIGSFEALTRGRAALIAFFYTRCMNPYKCSLTVSKLAEADSLLLKALGEDRYLVAGISYDPDYDNADRLSRFGLDRGMRFSASCQLLRATEHFADFSSALDLGVGYGSTTVNRHRIELLLIGTGDAEVRRLVRHAWDVKEVVEILAASC